ncbi:Cx9c motif-containing protein 4, mitochondrial [Plakobranchus ocellatus]|uniref:Cx9c motif-containing protein 4, mitochondrial n=1 Tax=Plakobranchus ocellatus TaxID=259542 RepID=A0AAV4D2C9_9GAST|nr:Cx9c motif-containing protein 4, mitochondrial [Plakobranchus ocellatus]
MGRKDPCKTYACALQSCLSANDFQESKCKAAIDALYECCAKFGTKDSIVCSGIHPKSKPGSPTVLEEHPKKL